jgi:hypothetical protein
MRPPLTGGEHLPPTDYTQENLQGLMEKVSTLGLQGTRRNHCGAAKKQARRARLAEAPPGDSDAGPSGSASGDKPLDLQKPGTSGAPHGQGSASAAQKSLKGRGHMQGPTKQLRSAKGTPEGRQAKRPKQIGQPS